jgi:hypothetical protein
MDGRGSVHLDRAIPPALEPVGGSALSTHDLFIWIQNWSFEYEFDCVNTNFIVFIMW